MDNATAINLKFTLMYQNGIWTLVSPNSHYYDLKPDMSNIAEAVRVMTDQEIKTLRRSLPKPIVAPVSDEG